MANRPVRFGFPRAFLGLHPGSDVSVVLTPPGERRTGLLTIRPHGVRALPREVVPAVPLDPSVWPPSTSSKGASIRSLEGFTNDPLTDRLWVRTAGVCGPAFIVLPRRTLRSSR